MPPRPLPSKSSTEPFPSSCRSPPFFLPLFGNSIGLSTTTSSFLLAGFNLASALGRICFGLTADSLFGSVNSMIISLFTVALTTLVIWPFADSVGPLCVSSRIPERWRRANHSLLPRHRAVFAVINGFCAGGYFSLMTGVVSSLFGSKRMPVVFSMLISFWAPG